MGYGMKYTKGGFPFKASPAKAGPEVKQFDIDDHTEKKTKPKVDPDAPGTQGTPGYEPSVKRSDLDAKGKAIWDKNHAKKSAGVGSGSNRKVMKNGAKNNAIYKGKPVKGDFTPHQFQ